MSGKPPILQYVGLTLGSAVVVGALMFGAVKVLGTTDSTGADTAAVGEGGGEGSGEAGNITATTAEDGATTEETEVVSSTPSTVKVDPLLIPISAIATNERAAVSKLRCGGSNSFEAAHLIDGDPQTGWGASVGDGAGQSATIDFGQIVTLSRVGLSPGYLRVAPRGDLDCEDALAFEYNRFVTEVRYSFDDGSSISQTFEQVAEVQEVPVEIRTKFVTITIISTIQLGDDQDTIISDAVFYGTTE